MKEIWVQIGSRGRLPPAVNKLVEIGPTGPVLEDTTCEDDEFAVCVVDDVTVWLDRDDRDGEGDEARFLKGRCASSRCRRLTFVDGVRFPLISTNIWYRS